MITTVWLMVRSRRVASLTVVLLTALVVAVAVAPATYLAYADRALINSEARNAPAAGLSVSASSTVAVAAGDREFESVAPPLFAQPWLTTTFGVDVTINVVNPVLVAPHDSDFRPLIYREDVCGHVTVVAGRCVVAARELMVSEDLATLLKLTVGDPVQMYATAYSPIDGLTRVGSPILGTVVGVFRPDDPLERYWGDNRYFAAPDTGAPATPPILGLRDTIDAIADDEIQHVDGVLRVDAVRPSEYAGIRATIATIKLPPTDQGSTVNGMAPFFTAVDHDRHAVRELIPVVALSVVGLGSFVLFLVVAYAVGQRRTEVGVIALRGTRLPSRWWFAAGESLVGVGVGIVAGFAVGPLAGRLLASATLTDTSGARDPASYGPVPLLAIGLLLLAALAAHRRTLAESVVEVLRRVPARGGTWRSVAAETLLVALAAAAVAQLYTQRGDLAGLEFAAPALVVAALAVVVARVVPPLFARVGDACLRRRRPRLGLGLGALHLARRPGAARVLAVQIVAIGIAGFAVIASVIAGQARVDQVRSELGAATVLSLDPVTASQLTTAVHRADPDGHYAMGVATLTPELPSDPPMLAIDSDRLAAVVDWPADAGATPAQVAALLRPQVPADSLLRASRVQLDILATGFVGGPQVRLSMVVSPVDGAVPTTVALGPLRSGDQTYAGDVPCDDGCRIAAITVDQVIRQPFAGSILIRSITTVTPTQGEVPVHLDDATTWQVNLSPGQAPAPIVLAVAGGLQASITTPGTGYDLSISPSTALYALPVVSTDDGLRPTLRVLNDSDQPVHRVGAVHRLPRVGTFGLLVDLGFAAQGRPDVRIAQPEIWLAPDTPQSVIRALVAGGVSIVSQRRASDQVGMLDQQGPAIGTRANLALAVTAPLLALVCVLMMAGIDRRARADEFRMLRAQGLRISVVRRATLVTQLLVAFSAAVIGSVAAAVAWLATGFRIPVLPDGSAARQPLPDWPTLVVPGAIVAALVAIVAVAIAVDTTRLVRRAYG